MMEEWEKRKLIKSVDSKLNTHQKNDKNTSSIQNQKNLKILSVPDNNQLRRNNSDTNTR